MLVFYAGISSCDEIISVLNREVRGSILVEDNLFLAIKLQPDLIIRAILQVVSILRSKLKIEIESKKFLLDVTMMLNVLRNNTITNPVG